MKLRMLMGMASGWMSASAVLNVIHRVADIPQRKTALLIADAVVAVFLAVAIPMERADNDKRWRAFRDAILRGVR